MIRPRTLRVLSGGLLLALSLPATAQRQGEVTFYSEIAFRGQSFTVTGPRANLRVPFTVRSAKIAAGDRWEICTEARYRGRCNEVSEAQGNVAWTVRSARPAQGGGLAPGNQQSLRGMASEYFPQPSDWRGRVLSCPEGSATASCAARSADRFCVSKGWTASSYERQETVRGRVYLADVLCTRTR
jgi:hypothetical protein